MTFFELSLRKHNYLSFNRVFEDMRNEVVDFHSICLGPFPEDFSNFDITISYMKKDTIEHIFEYKKWVDRLLENQHEENLSLKESIFEWKEVKVGNETKYFLIFWLKKLEQKVWGDFKVQFKINDKSLFYMWLNVSAILYN